MFPSNLQKRTNFSNIVVNNPECDKYIEQELKEAGTEISSGYENWRMKPIKQSSGFMLISEIDNYTMKFTPKSEVPFHIIGRWKNFTFERAWYYYMIYGNVPSKIAKELYENPIGKRDVRVNGNCGCPEPKGDVDTYHIDSQEGLNLFIKTIKKYNLNGE